MSLSQLNWLNNAAKLGEAQAMRDLAFIYANALGIDADEEKARTGRTRQMPQSKYNHSPSFDARGKTAFKSFDTP